VRRSPCDLSPAPAAAPANVHGMLQTAERSCSALRRRARLDPVNVSRSDALSNCNWEFHFSSARRELLFDEFPERQKSCHE
jgi:hypothetical protein